MFTQLHVHYTVTYLLALYTIDMGMIYKAVVTVRASVGSDVFDCWTCI